MTKKSEGITFKSQSHATTVSVMSRDHFIECSGDSQLVTQSNACRQYYSLLM